MCDLWLDKCRELGAPLHCNLSQKGLPVTTWEAFFALNQAFLFLEQGKPLPSISLDVAHKIVDLDLSRHTTLDDQSLGSLIAHFPKIKKLNLNGCSKACSAVASAILSSKHLRSLSILRCPLLELDALVQSKKSYQELSISDRILTPNGWSRILQQPLRSLHLHRVQLQKLNLQKENLPHLRHLNLTECGSMSPEGLGQFLSLAPNLTALKLHHIRKLEATCALRFPKKLKMLELSWCENLLDQTVEAIVKSVPHIESLKLAYCSLLTSKTLNHIAHLKNLKRVDVSHLPLVTPEGLHDFLIKCPKLEHLNIVGCSTNKQVATALNGKNHLKSLALPSEFCASWLTNRSFPRLEKVRLQDNESLDGDGILSLLPMLKEWGVKCLDILGCCISDASMAQIAQMDNLTELHVGGRVGKLLSTPKQLMAQISDLPKLNQLHLALVTEMDSQLLNQIVVKSPATLALELGPCPKLGVKDLEALCAKFPLSAISFYGYSHLPLLLRDLLFTNAKKA